MASHAEIFDQLLTRLRSKVRGSVALRVLKKEEDHLAIQVGGNSEAVLGVRIKDSECPSFYVSYPKLTVKKDGGRHIALTDFDGAVFSGVEWIVGELAEH